MFNDVVVGIETKTIILLQCAPLLLTSECERQNFKIKTYNVQITK